MHAIVGLLLFLGAVDAVQVYRADGIACAMHNETLFPEGLPIIDDSTGECYAWNVTWDLYGTVVDEETGKETNYFPPSPPPVPNLPPFPDDHYSEDCEVCAAIYELERSGVCTCESALRKGSTGYCYCAGRTCQEVCDDFPLDGVSDFPTSCETFSQSAGPDWDSQNPLLADREFYMEFCTDTPQCDSEEASFSCWRNFHPKNTNCTGHADDQALVTYTDPTGELPSVEFCLNHPSIASFTDFTREFLDDFFDRFQNDNAHSDCLGIDNYCTCGRDAPNSAWNNRRRRRLMFGAWKDHCHCILNFEAILPAETTDCGCTEQFLLSNLCSCSSCVADASLVEKYGTCKCFLNSCSDLDGITFVDASDKNYMQTRQDCQDGQSGALKYYNKYCDETGCEFPEEQ